MAKKGSPEDRRVDELCRKLTGTGSGQTSGSFRHQVQQILYVEDACRSLLETIGKLHAIDPDDFEGEIDTRSLMDDFRRELHFLKTLMNEKQFLGSLEFVNRSRP